MDNLLKLIEKASGRTAIKGIVIGKATEITDSTCTVERDLAPAIYDVRLHAVDDDLTSKVTIVPKEGSYVLVGIIENLSTEAVILKCSEIEKVLIKIGTAEYEVTAQGHKLEASGENLKQVLSDFIDEVMKIIVVQGRGPNVGVLTTIKQRLLKILK